MANQKVVFFDIDGTLLHDGHFVPESTKLAIKQLQENGVYVAIATGRGPAMLSGVRELLNIDTIIGYNGQIVVHQNEIIYKRPQPTADLEHLTARAHKNGHTLVYLGENQGFSTKPSDQLVQESLGKLDIPLPAFHEQAFLTHDVFQTLVYCTAEEEAEYVQNYQAFDFIRWHPHAMDVINVGSSKADGIKQFLKLTNIRREDTFAFGDALNDLEMLRYVGTGIAMGNGLAETKAAADFVTKHILEDGIAHGLKEFQLI
ncbi:MULTISPECIES: Cof-type HAD-IIB family hydrolase [Exiguobacterium]|uniref:Cof-type HAD-IIB family hydrolase n=1 Tax=Exiguobacterium antarcticum TaxID=132920 RepID=A0ABT6QYM9_9BACL|nr:MULTISPECIES: Cof-type HAD-IIB family hydrolase [Exiguobacterium]AFS70972.1 Haloacid dehalogenase-like hydrolase [Exiguobacterium antarcticum B7]MCT4780157.1 Cof-type HAD-IIB family hydrolase [Exiguobacterium soli]MDI3233713.1 Cof-type HAD-IIB family hydrolase [Exiguobacterium antarcticum]